MLMSFTKGYDPTPLIFSKLIDYIPQALFWQDNQGLYLGCNVRYMKLLGFDHRRELLGFSDIELQQKYLELGQVKPIPRNVNRIPLLDERGVQQGTLGIIDLNDVTMSAVTQKSRVGYEQLRQILDTIPIPVFWKDKQGCYQGCNHALTELLQVESKTFCGHSDQTLYWHEFAVQWRKDDVALMQGELSRNVEVVLTRPDNSQVNVLVTKVPLRESNGEIIGIVGSMTDISEYRSVEAELIETQNDAVSSQSAKNKIFENIGYNLRAPLHGILGLSKVLELRNKELEHKQLISGIRQSAKVISYLVEDILSFAKQGTTPIQLESEPFDLRELVEEVVDMSKASFDEAKLQVMVVYSETTPRYVLNDFHAIRRILINLLNNAIQSTQTGHIIVSVESIEVKDDWAYLQIAVEDTGQGLKVSLLEQVVSYFNAANEDELAEDIGVGLTVVRCLVRELGAKMTINSQEGKGAIFQCSLPCPLQMTGFDAAEQLQRHYLEMPLLMVDDNAVRGNIVLDQIVAQEGHLASSATAYNDFLFARQSKKPYQVVLVDDEVQDSVLLAQQIQAQQVVAPNKAMLVLSSHRETSTKRLEELKLAGYFLVIAKPTHPRELIQKIGSAWQRWQEGSMTSDVQSNSPEPQPQEKKRATRLLLVEDNMLAQFAMQSLLEDLGYYVSVATCGVQALEKFDDDLFDVVLMDVGLPDIDGITLSRKLLAPDSQYKSKHAAVIVLSAYVTEEQKVESFKLGLKRILTKPVARDDLHATIQEVLLESSNKAEDTPLSKQMFEAVNE